MKSQRVHNHTLKCCMLALILSVLPSHVRSDMPTLTASTLSMRTNLLQQSQEIWATFILNELKYSSVKDMDFE